MLAKLLTCAVVGLDGAIVQVEVDISPGMSKFNVVGLPDAAVQKRASGCGQRSGTAASTFRTVVWL